MKNTPHSRGAVAAYLGRITVTDRGGITDRADSARGLWPVTITYDGIVEFRARIERRGDECHVTLPVRHGDDWGTGYRSGLDVSVSTGPAVVSITDPDLRAALTIAAYDYVIQYESDKQAQEQADKQRRIDQVKAARDKAAA